MRILILVFIIIFYSSLKGQDHFVKYIDLYERGQFSSQIMALENEYLLVIQTKCPDLINSCGGICKVNIDGEIRDMVLDQDFSGNHYALTMYNDQYWLAGEYKMGIAEELSILTLDSNIKILDTILYSQNDSNFYNYFATGSLIFDNKHITIGSSFCDPDCPQISHLFSYENAQVDTSITFSFVEEGYTILSNGYNYKDDQIALFFRFKDFDTNEDSLKIIRLDTSFNQTFDWSIEVRQSNIPRGCVTQDDNMIITLTNDTWLNIIDVWSIAQDGEVIWKYLWEQDIKYSNILRVEESENGDLFVMGQLINPTLFNDARFTAFLMRLDSNGNELWRRYIRNEQDHNILSGYVSDLEELDNGDLLLTGQIKRIIYEDGGERIDQDILWARIGGDGCINDDCSEVYVITSTEDQLNKTYDKIDIYPNPLRENTLTIEVKDGESQVAIIYGLDGQVIKEQDLTYGVNTLTLETNPSILLVRILDAEGRLVHLEKVLRL